MVRSVTEAAGQPNKHFNRTRKILRVKNRMFYQKEFISRTTNGRHVTKKKQSGTDIFNVHTVHGRMCSERTRELYTPFFNDL